MVEGDTWQTFMAFSATWANLSNRDSKTLEKCLPRIYEIDEDQWQDEPQEREEEADISSQVSLQVPRELTDLRNKLNRQRVLLYAIIGLLVWLLLFAK
ncbi:MAG: hypothetical protein NTW55_00405 [Planctomycetota bacterium]|nr:hypothetical protein [Planctomycetota bacterium]